MVDNCEDSKQWMAFAFKIQKQEETQIFLQILSHIIISLKPLVVLMIFNFTLVILQSQNYIRKIN